MPGCAPLDYGREVESCRAERIISFDRAGRPRRRSRIPPDGRAAPLSAPDPFDRLAHEVRDDRALVATRERLVEGVLHPAGNAEADGRHTRIGAIQGGSTAHTPRGSVGSAHQDALPESGFRRASMSCSTLVRDVIRSVVQDDLHAELELVAGA